MWLYKHIAYCIIISHQGQNSKMAANKALIQQEAARYAQEMKIWNTPENLAVRATLEKMPTRELYKFIKNMESALDKMMGDDEQRKMVRRQLGWANLIFKNRPLDNYTRNEIAQIDASLKKQPVQQTKSWWDKVKSMFGAAGRFGSRSRSRSRSTRRKKRVVRRRRSVRRARSTSRSASKKRARSTSVRRMPKKRRVVKRRMVLRRKR
jgi:hypothetical protein